MPSQEHQLGLLLSGVLPSATGHQSSLRHVWLSLHDLPMISAAKYRGLAVVEVTHSAIADPRMFDASHHLTSESPISANTREQDLV
jgi:hypothetical protein